MMTTAQAQAREHLAHIVDLVRRLLQDAEDGDAARAEIEDLPLEVLVRSGWHRPGEAMESEDYQILLATGGPAVRIVGTLNQWGEPETAKLQFQDWFTPWEELETSAEDVDALLTFARQFYYGE